MVTILFTCRVSDYDSRRAAYERGMQGMPGNLSCRLWRSQDDPHTKDRSLTSAADGAQTVRELG